MLCARAGEAAHATDSSAARNDATAGKIFDRQIVPTRIMGLPAL